MEPHEAKVVANFLIGDVENEMQTTLRVFGAVPHGKLDTSLIRSRKLHSDCSATSHWKTNGS